MVPEAGLEPAQLAPLPPQGSVSTNSTTRAKNYFPFDVSGAAGTSAAGAVTSGAVGASPTGAVFSAAGVA